MFFCDERIVIQVRMPVWVPPRVQTWSISWGFFYWFDFARRGQDTYRLPRERDRIAIHCQFNVGSLRPPGYLLVAVTCNLQHLEVSLWLILVHYKPSHSVFDCVNILYFLHSLEVNLEYFSISRRCDRLLPMECRGIFGGFCSPKYALHHRR